MSSRALFLTKPKFTTDSIGSLLLPLLLLSLVCYYLINQYQQKSAITSQSQNIVLQPQINDIYFLDFTKLSSDLRPKEKYRIAKVVDITGDVITLLYGDWFYPEKHTAINAIRYGQLTYRDYFQTKRYNLSYNDIQTMFENNAIYRAERPERDLLFGQHVSHHQTESSRNYLIYGVKENTLGEAQLKDHYSETQLQSAFENFKRSAELGYMKGQVNLAQMYINGQHVKQDYNQALYWLNKAALQSYKPAILKYGIICEKVTTCNIVDFYQNLANAGVNIKVRAIKTKID